MYLDSEKKKEIFEKYGKSNTDTGSPEAQIALFSYRIAHLTEHLKSNHKDHSTERALKMLVGKPLPCHHCTKRVGYQKVIFRYTATKKRFGKYESLFLLPHIDGKPYSRLSRSFVGISAQ